MCIVFVSVKSRVDTALNLLPHTLFAIFVLSSEVRIGETVKCAVFAEALSSYQQLSLHQSTSCRRVLTVTSFCKEIHLF